MTSAVQLLKIPLFSSSSMDKKLSPDDEFIKKYQAHEKESPADFIKRYSSTETELRETIAYLIRRRENLQDAELEKENLATRITQFVLQGVSQNKRRHDTVQKFMIMNDSVTVATEVPVYLLPEDINHLKAKLGFQIPLDDKTTISGHIDALQMRNGAIHILDYKPNARHEKPIEQLTFYALALSRRTGLRLYDFKCTWFDENHYFEFFPLHVVLKKPRKKPFS